MNLAQAAWEDGKVGVVIDLLDRHLPKDGEDDLAALSGIIGTGSATGSCYTLKGHTSPVWSVAFSPDGTRIASGAGLPDRDNTVQLWDAATGQEVFTLRGHASPVWSVAFSPNRSQIAAAAYGGLVIVWDTATGRTAHALDGHSGEFTCVAFSPDGTRIAAGTGDLKIWDAATGREVQTLKGHAAEVTSVAFEPGRQADCFGEYG